MEQPGFVLTVTLFLVSYFYIKSLIVSICSFLMFQDKI